MADKSLDFSTFRWINTPSQFRVGENQVTIISDPGTDFWQRTYYGFRNDNAHAFVTTLPDSQFSFTVKTTFKSQKLFDQCGIVLYQDSDNWFKASVEYEDENNSKLGSVVTNLGYSDWATMDIDSSRTTLFYRLSRRGQDFLVEQSWDGQDYKQMRLFHMHQPLKAVNVGFYACSPLQSSICADFSEVSLGPCRWAAFVNPDPAA